MVSVAVVQMKSSEDKQDNLQRSVAYIEQAAAGKAGMVCFPEFQMAFSPGTQTASELSRLAETVQGNFVTTLRKAAKAGKIEVVAAMYEKGTGNRVYDTAVVISCKGEITSVYRKLHLYDALGFKESKKLIPGKKLAKPAKTAAVGNIGVMICYDIRFPELSRLLTIKGAGVLVAPSGWVQGPMKEEHWQTMLKARAIENGSYVVAPDQVGNIYAGRSMVIDPFGTVLLDMGQREGMEIVELDMGKVKQVRQSLPLLKNRRTDVYSLSSKKG
ncbi:carbon-nitrogen hydrolase family protein [Nitrososphaera viennensis]|uniref:Carbon-nitrogen hydrolase family protein n=2 Tax=Nitrososphaera viennensis TaxID=1034015 RepID=A0A977ICF0_9ARCH|nr:carbon-nitrogen hydrolase family protein [Nitrososphaera viennensis]AIC16294.1 putative carbon-nitrogen hydrolase [Nitrososphaera viennensis EN76]UVS68231.1 carbon-nitrogen hydrolase family protein [Nitrososphaera viennensis]